MKSFYIQFTIWFCRVFIICRYSNEYILKCTLRKPLLTAIRRVQSRKTNTQHFNYCNVLLLLNDRIRVTEKMEKKQKKRNDMIEEQENKKTRKDRKKKGQEDKKRQQEKKR